MIWIDKFKLDAFFWQFYLQEYIYLFQELYFKNDKNNFS